MEGKDKEHHQRHIPDHVAQYLARRVLADLPERVYETLISLTPEELEVLERVGASLNECEPHQYTIRGPLTDRRKPTASSRLRERSRSLVVPFARGVRRARCKTRGCGSSGPSTWSSSTRSSARPCR